MAAVNPVYPAEREAYLAIFDEIAKEAKEYLEDYEDAVQVGRLHGLAMAGQFIARKGKESAELDAIVQAGKRDAQETQSQ